MNWIKWLMSDLFGESEMYVSESQRILLLNAIHVPLYHAVQKWWARHQATPTNNTEGLISLIFAYGMAKQNEKAFAKHLHKLAYTGFMNENQSVLRQCYEFRIQELLDGTIPAKNLPDEILEFVETQKKLDAYRVEKYLSFSRILQPLNQPDPYHKWRKYPSENTGVVDNFPAPSWHETEEGMKEIQKLISKPDDLGGEEMREVLLAGNPFQQEIHIGNRKHVDLILTYVQHAETDSLTEFFLSLAAVEDTHMTADTYHIGVLKIVESLITNHTIQVT